MTTFSPRSWAWLSIFSPIYGIAIPFLWNLGLVGVYGGPAQLFVASIWAMVFGALGLAMGYLAWSRAPLAEGGTRKLALSGLVASCAALVLALGELAWIYRQAGSECLLHPFQCMVGN